MAAETSKDVKHLASAEQQKIRDILSQQGAPTEALADINKARAKKGMRELEKSSHNPWDNCRICGLHFRATAILCFTSAVIEPSWRRLRQI